MQYIVNCKDTFYLMYFAIDLNFRNKGYGSKSLEDLKEKYKTIFLSIEKNDDKLSVSRKKILSKKWLF